MLETTWYIYRLLKATNYSINDINRRLSFYVSQHSLQQVSQIIRYRTLRNITN